MSVITVVIDDLRHHLESVFKLFPGTGLNTVKLNCMNFGKLIIRKIIKIVATRCQILKLNCIKFDFGWGSVP